MIVLSGASASGKTEVAKVLAKKYGITKVITTTTRSMREGETNGKDYFFISKEEFLEKIKNKEFVEYVTYNDNYYGSTKDQVAADKCIVTEPNGLKSYIKLKRQNKNIITFFLESDEATRYERMLLRGDGKKKAIERIKGDRIAFSKENIPHVDFHIESEESSVEEVADTIYNKYQEKLNKIKK